MSEQAVPPASPPADSGTRFSWMPALGSGILVAVLTFLAYVIFVGDGEMPDTVPWGLVLTVIGFLVGAAAYRYVVPFLLDIALPAGVIVGVLAFGAYWVFVGNGGTPDLIPGAVLAGIAGFVVGVVFKAHVIRLARSPSVGVGVLVGMLAFFTFWVAGDGQPPESIIPWGVLVGLAAAVAGGLLYHYFIGPLDRAAALAGLALGGVALLIYWIAAGESTAGVRSVPMPDAVVLSLAALVLGALGYHYLAGPILARRRGGGAVPAEPRVAPASTGAPDGSNVILKLDDIEVYYGTIQALKGISLEVRKGEIVTLIGANGAGKSTTLRSINGLNHPREGTISFQGTDITATAPHEIVDMGISQSPEGRHVFTRMSVLENLEMGAYQRSAESKAVLQEDLDRVFSLFPRLEERKAQKAGTLSGGEQQMLAMGRALMARPKLLLLDEPSMGLAPIFVEKIFEIIVEINSQGTPILLVEQNALMALDVANRGYVLETGHVALADDAKLLRNNEQVRKTYLGED